MSVCYDCCVLSCRVVLRRADHSSREVLPSAVCLSVILSLDSEEAMAHYRLLCRKNTSILT
jgi:hypothetical protein